MGMGYANEDDAYDAFVQRQLDDEWEKDMSCKVLMEPQVSATPLTVFKKVIQRIDNPGSMNISRYFEPEYHPGMRGPIEGWHGTCHDPNHTADPMTRYRGAVLRYEFNMITESPGGPGIMVYVDAPTRGIRDANDLSGIEVWIAGHIPADTKYYVGFHHSARILCAARFMPLYRLVR